MRLYISLVIMFLILNKAYAQRTVGLLDHDRQSEDGYVLFPPLASKTTYLLDKCGKQIRSWTSNYTAGACAYLMDDGSLLRAGNSGNLVFSTSALGGVIERYDWNGTLTWSYNLSDSFQCQHHDIAIMPNGHLLVIAWDYKTRAEAIAMGRETSRLANALWSEKIVELEPTGTNSANIVWEWKLWDHLIQNVSTSKPNYDSIRNHPERVNINYTGGSFSNADWIHLNGIDYNADLDQIVVSSYYLDEIWIIDHSTTTAEAAGSTGGRQGKGGDLLYRWGNPQSYILGTVSDQKMFGPHSPRWIEKGKRDAGGILFFNNGVGRFDGSYSTVEILFPPVNAQGEYSWTPRSIYSPASAQLVYKAANPTDFYSPNVSNAQRLSGGNTIICEGAKGRMFEVDSAGNTLWNYINPDASFAGPVSQGDQPPFGGVFKCIQYPPGFSGFQGKSMTPGVPVELNPGSYDCYFEVATAVGNEALSASEWKAENPFTDQLRIRFSGKEQRVQLRLMSAFGQVCESWTDSFGGQQQKSLQIAQALTPGLYFLEIRNGSGKREILKLQRY